MNQDHLSRDNRPITRHTWPACRHCSFCNRCVHVLFFCCLSFLCSLLVLFPFLKILFCFFIIISFFFFQQFLSIVMPNSVNARCFPCKNTLRPSVVHNLTKISSFDQKMWAKETNRFFFFQSIFHFFSFSSVFFFKRAGGIFPFLFWLLHYFLLFFLCTIWGEKMNEYNSILCIPVLFFSTHSLQKRSSRLTP